MLFLAKVLVLLPGLILGITVHESAHALTAKWLGDHLGQRMGRISLNPFRHLSLWGTLALFILGFGWGKPVPVNLYNFKRPKLDYLLCSLAGPVSNIILCAIILGLLYLKPGVLIELILTPIFFINAILAVINLLPIPPLDGSKIWPCIIPGMRPVVSGKWSTVWVVVLIVGLYSGVLDKVILPVMNQTNRVLNSVLYYSPRPEGFPEVLSAPQDAYRKQFYIYPPKSSDPNSFHLSFVIDEPYPAEQLISFLETNLTQHNYRRLSYQLSDPNKIAEDSWQADTEEDAGIYFWKQGWVDKEGKLITIYISYMSEGASKSQDASVALVLYNKIPSSGNVSEYKRLHPEEFESSR